MAKAKKKDAAAVSLGRRGGLARARNLSRARLREIGLLGNAVRWGKREARK